MAEDNTIQLFEGQQVRYVWDSEKEKYFFSVVDVIQVLTETDRPRKYWSDLKHKLETEGSEVSEKIGQLNRYFEELSNFGLTEHFFHHGWGKHTFHRGLNFFN